MSRPCLLQHFVSGVWFEGCGGVALLLQAASSKEEMQQQLDDAVEARDEAREALAVAKSVNAGLDGQVKELLQQLAEASRLGSCAGRPDERQLQQPPVQ